jgi:hypothetical protein
LIKVNKFDHLPTLFCKKKIGHLESILIAIAITIITGEKITINIKENIISNNLFNIKDQPSRVEFLYSRATILFIASGE